MQFTFSGTTIRVNMPDRGRLEAEIRRRLEAGEGFALATLNLDHLDKLARSPAFRRAYAAQDLVVADGNPIVWLSRLARRPVTLVPGADLVVPLVRWAHEAGAGVALVGSTGAALAAAARRLERDIPGARIACRIAPPMGFDPDGVAAEAILTQIRESGAGLVLLALGAPRQERLAARGRHMLPATGFASVGAGLDFLAGRQRRAPLWLRRLALEWLWRALDSPARLGRRYLRSALALPGHAWRAWRLGRRPGPGPDPGASGPR